MKVSQCASKLAAEDELDYQFSSVEDHDDMMIPIPKMHKKVTTSHRFGEIVDGEYKPYAPCASQSSYVEDFPRGGDDDDLTKSCNPPNFEYVPVARTPTKEVPSIHMQLTGLKADLVQGKSGPVQLRWLGLQKGRYVSLPTTWVEDNFDETFLAHVRGVAETKLKAKGKKTKGKQPSKKLRFIPIPVGASRDDDPPVPIRHKRGFNYYYQGKVDNCVMGGLVNAVFWKMGPQQADKLLSNYTPAVINEDLWDGFVQHINRLLTGYLMKRFMAYGDVLLLDDLYPMVVHLKATDNSSNHAVCIFDGCIFDSASRYILRKNADAMNWCCGPYSYARHLRMYRLEPVKQAPQPTVHQRASKKKKRSRQRFRG